MNLWGTIILFALAPLPGLAQNPDSKTSRTEPPSDRVRSGLRGITRSWPASDEQEQTFPAQNSEAHFTYQYDGHGNWTEKVTSNSSSAGAPFETTDTRRRTLTYF
jgi:hypothetical protein